MKKLNLRMCPDDFFRIRNCFLQILIQNISTNFFYLLVRNILFRDFIDFFKKFFGNFSFCILDFFMFYSFYFFIKIFYNKIILLYKRKNSILSIQLNSCNIQIRRNPPLTIRIMKSTKIFIFSRFFKKSKHNYFLKNFIQNKNNHKNKNHNNRNIQNILIFEKISRWNILDLDRKFSKIFKITSKIEYLKNYRNIIKKSIYFLNQQFQKNFLIVLKYKFLNFEKVILKISEFVFFTKISPYQKNNLHFKSEICK